MSSNSFGSRMKHAWNAFMNKDPTPQNVNYFESSGYYSRPDRFHFSRGVERSIVTSVYNRIALDTAAIDIRHVQLDENDRFVEYRDSYLDYCLSVEANLDQTSRAFIQDVVMSMMDEGCVAIIPITATANPNLTSSFDVGSMRTARITQWRPYDVTVSIYNEMTGKREEKRYNKSAICIIENPLYAVMNEPNSTMQRLIRKLSLMDIVDEQSSAGKLDLIIQLPYTIKSDARRKQAEERRESIEKQLAGSKYGIAYADATEHIVQLNRSLENNLMKQVEYLTALLYSQLGITEAILNGSASEQELTNYYTRTIEPIISAITDEMKRKFLSKTAITQKQSIEFFRDPFKLVPIGSIADIADKFTRNCIMTSNEMRQVVGMKPVSDPMADQLINSNLNHTPEELEGISGEKNDEEEYQNE